MLNYIWPIFIIVSIIYALITGNISSVNDGIFESCKSAVDLSLTFIGTICLWTGLMEIVKNTTVIYKLKKMLSPVMKLLFPKINKDDIAYEDISMNLIANILGLGNAATPIGLKAMTSLQKLNNKKDELSEEMMMFIVLNTASLQIVPTTVLAIRNSLGSNDPTKIIIPVWIATICAAITGIVCTKVLIHSKKRGM